MRGRITDRVYNHLGIVGEQTAEQIGVTFWSHRSGCGGHGPDRPTSIALRFLGRMAKAGLVVRLSRGERQSLWRQASHR